MINANNRNSSSAAGRVGNTQSPYSNSFFLMNRISTIFAFQFFRYGNYVMILNIETVLNFYK